MVDIQNGYYFFIHVSVNQSRTTKKQTESPPELIIEK